MGRAPPWVWNRRENGLARTEDQDEARGNLNGEHAYGESTQLPACNAARSEIERRPDRGRIDRVYEPDRRDECDESDHEADLDRPLRARGIRGRRSRLPGYICPICSLGEAP